MKTMLTCFAVLCFGISLSAQEPKYPNILDYQVEVSKDTSKELKKRFPKKGSTARLYLFKNSRVKKALAFRTKANKAKLA